MLYNLLSGMEKILLSFILSLSCGLCPLPQQSPELAEAAFCSEDIVSADEAVRKLIMDSAQIRLSFPELDFSVPVRYCLLGEAQDYVDMPNMAAMFQNTLSENTGCMSFEIGDHNNQGFDIINQLSPGMECLINFNGQEFSFICTGIDKEAMNCIDCLAFSDGSLLDPSYPLGIYTCSYDGVHISLAVFEPAQ